MHGQQARARRRTFLKGAGAMAAAPFASHVAGATDETTETDKKGKRVVGYYPYWAESRGYTPADVPYGKVTHLNYAFIRPQPNGEIIFDGSGSAPDVVERLSEQSRQRPDTSFIFSASSGWYSGDFSDAASTAERRSRFAESAIELLREFDFDGIDIDWEYPDGTIREEDPQNLTLLLKEIRERMDEAEQEDGKTYELTMAAAPAPWNADPLEVEKIDEYLDSISVMNYNFHGAWSNETHFNAPLYTSPDAPTPSTVLTCDGAMQYWADRPIPNEKLDFGLPFYGRAHMDVPNENRGLFQPFGDVGTRTYWEIVENIKTQTGCQYHWHSDARVPWLYSKKDGVFVTYDDRHSVMEKSKYVRDNGFGGMMCWELSQDRSNTLVDAIHAVLGD